MRRASSRLVVSTPLTQLSASPPLRPLAPFARKRASQSAIRFSGKRRAIWYAVEVPVKPPPTMATSQSRSFVRAGDGTYDCSGHQTERFSSNVLLMGTNLREDRRRVFGGQASSVVPQ